jgi:hypothetical protein
MCVSHDKHKCHKFKRNHETCLVTRPGMQEVPMPVHYCRCGMQWLDFGEAVVIVGDLRKVAVLDRKENTK